MTAAHRSIHPNVPGVPWWAAVLVALTATAVGFAFDAGTGNKELTNVFAALYALGCVAAVLVVQQSAIFTAVVQPPLILFFSVPGSYWLFHDAKIPDIKEILINYGYPLVERFPLMAFTSAGVLLIGLVRWYLALTARRSAADNGDAATTAATGSRIAGIGAKLASIWRRESADEKSQAPVTGSRRRRTGQPAKAPDPARRDRATKRPGSTRARQGRPSPDGPPESATERTRRRYPTRTQDAETAAEPRRPRSTRDPDLRGRPPGEIRRDPHLRKGRPTTRSSRFDPYEPMESAEPLTSYGPRRRPPAHGTNSEAPTHHPVSRVRYRGAAKDDRPREEPRATRARRTRPSDPEHWEYDI